MNKVADSQRVRFIYIYIYILFVILYAFGIVYNSSVPVMAGDDIAFYTALKKGEQVWHGLNFSLSRFFPLAGWNLNLVALFSISPYAFMIGNACVFVISAWAFWRIAVLFGASAKWIALAAMAFFLSAGYTHIVTSICYPELTQIMFLLLFVLMAFWYYKSKKIVWFVLALIFGNACIYMKEVAFILIGGFGFFHLFFALWNEKFRFKMLDKKIVLFDVLCMLSGILFLGLYAYFAMSGGDYRNIVPYFSISHTIFISIFGTPILSILFMFMLLFRFYRIFKYKEKYNPIVDSVGMIALAYWVGYMVLGMASFHYFSPANILAFLYVLFCSHFYSKELNFLFARVVLYVSVGILLSSAILQGVNAFTTYKTQNKNTNDAFMFLADYIRKSPTKVNLYFDGFCRGYDRCIGALFHQGAVFSILPRYYDVNDNYDIKSKEPNGTEFSIDSSSPFTFFNSDEVSEPQSGDIVILHYASSKYMTPSDVRDIVSQYEVLFVSNNYPYYPMYNLMSLGAFVLKSLGVSTSFANRGNVFKLPSQVYVLRVP